MKTPLLQRLWRIPSAFHQPAGLTPLPAEPGDQIAPLSNRSPTSVASAGSEARAPSTQEKPRYLCREADENDLEGIARLFRSHDYGTKNAKWLRWKYFENPDGRARVLVGQDAHGEIVALRALMPRLFTSRRTGMFFVRQAVDWFVAEAHRGSGVYSQLRELSVAKRDFPSIGFPNEISRRITKTYPGDVRVYHSIDEWWYPVRLGNPNGLLPFLSDALSCLYTFLWLGKRPKSLRMEPLKRFTRDYDFSPDFIHGVRSAKFLNWRFIDNPARRFFAYEFLEDGASVGYCVYDIDNSFAKIYDLVLPRRQRGCLRLLVDHFHDKGLSRIIFKSIGFQMRKYGFIRIGSPGDFDTLNTPQGKWLVTLADKD